MKLPQQKFRELAFQMFFSFSYTPFSLADGTSFYMEQLQVARKYILKAFEVVQKISSCEQELHQLLEKSSKEYSKERITKAEYTMLALLFYEVKYEQLPKAVAISEGVRLCNKFSNKSSAKFVHALLDAIL